LFNAVVDIYDGKMQLIYKNDNDGNEQDTNIILRVEERRPSRSVESSLQVDHSSEQHRQPHDKKPCSAPNTTMSSVNYSLFSADNSTEASANQDSMMQATDLRNEQ